jgi:hypothetical protein
VRRAFYENNRVKGESGDLVLDYFRWFLVAEAVPDSSAETTFCRSDWKNIIISFFFSKKNRARHSDL